MGKNMIFRKFIKNRLSVKFLQPLFQSLYSISIWGMNYGHGAGVGKSGETTAIKYALLKAKNPDNTVIFDVGSHIGLYSIAVRTASKKARILAFEPNPLTYEKLSLNVKDSNIKCYNIGFSDNKGETILHTNSDKSTLSSIYERNLDHLNIKLDQKVSIKTETIDDFCSTNNIDHIDLLKLDVEGHELAVLKGAKNLLQGEKIRCIQFEFGGCNIDSRTFFKDFWELLNDNYNFYRIVKNGLYPLKNYTTQHEIFTTTNFLLELKKQ